MSLSIEDLQPKPFTVTIKGVEVECQPLRLSDTLTLAKIGDVFNNASVSERKDFEQAEKDLDAVVAKLMPSIAGINLDISSTMELITQLMETVEPADNKELKDKGVSFDTDPKAQKIG